MNKVILIGNLTKEPKLITYDNGSLCRLDIAVNREYSDTADFFSIKVFGSEAEICNKYLVKGAKIGVEGRIENRQYEDKDGIKRTVTEVIAGRIEFLSKKAETPEPLKLEEVDDNALPF